MHHGMKRALGAATVLLVSVALVCLTGIYCERVQAQEYSDIADEPVEIQSAIKYCSEHGYLEGKADGYFYPQDPLTRIDYARALVFLFELEGEPLDKNITFKDLKGSDPNYKYANLAVKNDFLDPKQDGSFIPGGTVTTATALSGFVKGMGLDKQASYAQSLNPDAPSHMGYTVMALDLHLKYRYIELWPEEEYTRGMMAYSLEAADQVASWRVDYLEESFDFYHSQKPIVGEKRKAALDEAMGVAGAPYVWGGESKEEGGFDCSGMVYYVLHTKLGYPMMRVADDQARDSRYTRIGKEGLQAGDPVFFYGREEPEPGKERYINHAGMYIGYDLFIHSTGSNAGVSIDCLSGYWLEHFAGGTLVIDEELPETFDTYILLLNPTDETVPASVKFMLRGGRHYEKDIEVAPHSRKTVSVDYYFSEQDVSTEVRSQGNYLVAERAMYFRYNGLGGGHATSGITSAESEWYLPEGYTGGNFDTWILIQNPNPFPATTRVTFMKEGGGRLEYNPVIEPFARYTIMADAIPGLSSSSFSTKVEADIGLVVERAMYFEKDGIGGGHVSPGSPRPAKSWYLAEGCTRESFDTFVLIQNPLSRPVKIEITFVRNGEKNIKKSYELPACSRLTVPVDQIPGLGSHEFSTVVQVVGEGEVVVERSVYFNYKGNKGGHDALGVNEPAKEWYLAEGYTANGFDSYIILFNPQEEKVKAKLDFFLGDGNVISKEYTIAARSRKTVWVDEVEGLSSAEFSTKVSAEAPLVVERTMYFNYGKRNGGHCTTGLREKHASWYFAEGYTGF